MLGVACVLFIGIEDLSYRAGAQAYLPSYLVQEEPVAQETAWTAAGGSSPVWRQAGIEESEDERVGGDSPRACGGVQY